MSSTFQSPLISVLFSESNQMLLVFNWTVSRTKTNKQHTEFPVINDDTFKH